MSKIRLNIDGIECLGFNGETILEIAARNGLEIPTLCHDQRVATYGACGICVVERENSPKLLRACSTMAEDGMILFTDTPLVNKTRQTVLELLLSDHDGDCRPPCVLACPAQTDCQGYVGLIANGQYDEALKMIMQKIPLPGSIGRVCPHPCETACRRKMVEEPIGIAALKRFVADFAEGDYPLPQVQPASGKKVAIIGGGPGGLTAAYFLRQKGHGIDIYDAMPHMGGMLRYGIPEYRLPKDYLQQEIDIIAALGVKMINNVKIGRDLTLNWLRNNYDAVIVAVGAWTSSGLRCPGEELAGVFGGIDFLRDVALLKPVNIGHKVAIVGGGNTAMDACRTAIRLGVKEVYNVYRRTRDEMPAEEIEIKEAEEEGVIFRYLTNPIEVVDDGNGKVKGLRLQIMELGEPDASGRRAPIAVEGKEEFLEVDNVIAAIGQKLDACGLEDIEQTKWRTIIADSQSFLTNLEGVFAIGDATNDGASIAIDAIAEGQKVSKIIDRYLAGFNLEYISNSSQDPYLVKRDPKPEEFAKYAKEAKPNMSHETPAIRRNNFQELAFGLSEEQALKDANRCLECGCMDYFECKLIDYANQYAVAPAKYEGLNHQRKQEDNHPFIERNSDKCILCGLCVRICDEVVGKAALGLVDRGFDTIVKPALDLPLKESGCISCGQCINVCPTGALTEKTVLAKPIPLDEAGTLSTCAFCSVGCRVNLKHKGNEIVRALPFAEEEDKALLCVKGRFGFNQLKQQPRLIEPLIRNAHDELLAISYQEAFVEIAKRLQSLQIIHGSESIGVAVSDRLSSEEMYLIKELAKNTLHTDNVFSFNRPLSGVKAVLGLDCSTTDFEQLEHTDLVLAVETDIDKPHAVAGMALRKAAQNGAKIIALSAAKTAIDEIAAQKIDPGTDLQFLRMVLKAALSLNPQAEELPGYTVLSQSLADIEISEQAMALATQLIEAKKAIIIFEEHKLSFMAAKLLADLAVVTNHAFSPRSGIIRLKANANGRGLAAMAIKPVAEIDVDKLKGLMIFGEDVPDLPKLEFLAVQEIQMTKTAAKADIILPAASFAETDGLYVSTVDMVNPINAAMPSPTGLSNTEQLMAFAATAGQGMTYRHDEDIRQALSREGYAEMGQLRLQAIDNAALVEVKPNTNALYNDFVAYLQKEGL